MANNYQEELKKRVAGVIAAFPQTPEKWTMASTSDIGDVRMREIVTSKPVTREEASTIVAKYNSISTDMNAALKSAMKEHGFDVGFGERGAFIIGRKGMTLPDSRLQAVSRKRKIHVK